MGAVHGRGEDQGVGGGDGVLSKTQWSALSYLIGWGLGMAVTLPVLWLVREC
jgi:hypothetical protein